MTAFQSYISPIQTYFIGWCICAAGRHFNPTLVQFKPQAGSGASLMQNDFNPTLVQFKQSLDPADQVLSAYFNPTLVQFKLKEPKP